MFSHKIIIRFFDILSDYFNSFPSHIFKCLSRLDEQCCVGPRNFELTRCCRSTVSTSFTTSVGWANRDLLSSPKIQRLQIDRPFRPLKKYAYSGSTSFTYFYSSAYASAFTTRASPSSRFTSPRSLNAPTSSSVSFGNTRVHYQPFDFAFSFGSYRPQVDLDFSHFFSKHLRPIDYIPVPT